MKEHKISPAGRGLQPRPNVQIAATSKHPGQDYKPDPAGRGLQPRPNVQIAATSKHPGQDCKPGKETSQSLSTSSKAVSSHNLL